MVAMPSMTKDELYDYCFAKFKVKLDLRKPIEALMEEVGKLEKPVKAKEKPKSAYLLNTTNSRIFDYTDALGALEHMQPCDAKGKPL